MRRQGVAAQVGTKEVAEGKRKSFAQALPATVTIIKRKRNRKTKATDSLQRAIKSTTTTTAGTSREMEKGAAVGGATNRLWELFR